MKDLLHAGKLFSRDLTRDQNKDGQEGEPQPADVVACPRGLNPDVALR